MTTEYSSIVYVYVDYIVKQRKENIILHMLNSDDIVHKFKEAIREKEYDTGDGIEMTSIVIYTCYGCAYNCSGQRDHMEEGGCLYS